MKIQTSTVTKLMVTNIPDLYPISIYLEDLGPERGKITVTCFDDSWSYFWSHMGEGNTIRSFFPQCDNQYIIGKFASHLPQTVDDMDKLAAAAKDYICKERRTGDFTKEVARELYDDVEYLPGYESSDTTEYREQMYKIFGDEWYYQVPQQSNHKYEYLCRIINAVKEALRIESGGAS